jgi:hypothetical protein
MDEDKKRLWDVRLGAVAPFLTVIGIIIGVWQFNAGEEHRGSLEATSAIQKDDIEFRRKLWLEKLDAYKAVSTIAGRVIATPPGAVRDKAVQDFTSAYWGAMILVEDKAVEKAMVDFYLELRDEKTGWSRDPDRLKVRGEALIAVCRQSLEAGTPANLSQVGRP